MKAAIMAATNNSKIKTVWGSTSHDEEDEVEVFPVATAWLTERMRTTAVSGMLKCRFDSS